MSRLYPVVFKGDGFWWFGLTQNRLAYMLLPHIERSKLLGDFYRIDKYSHALELDCHKQARVQGSTW